MEFEELIVEAKEALQEADPLCVEANGFFEQCKTQIEGATLAWAKVWFFHDAYQVQLQNMGNAYIVLNNSIEGANSQSNDAIRRLGKAHQELTTLLRSLKNTKLFETDNNLYSFVHDQDIEKLSLQVTMLHDALKSSISEVKRIPELVQKEISSLREEAPQIENDKREVIEELAKSSDSVAPHVHEMALLLESVTKHYDLCLEAKTLTDNAEIEEVRSILSTDRLELKEALKQLHASYEVLKEQKLSTEQRLVSLRKSLDLYVTFFHRSDQFLRMKLRVYVDKLDAERTNLKSLLLQVGELISELNGLKEYYQLFLQGYNALLKEQVRRKKYDETMRSLIAEVNKTLQTNYQQELDARTAFIHEYGEYLPKDIWDQLYEIPQIYSLKEH